MNINAEAIIQYSYVWLMLSFTAFEYVTVVKRVTDKN